VFDGAGTNIPYGHPATPAYLGSGGSRGSSNYDGGNGGGLVKITASEAVVVDGSILASGQVGSGNQSGSGSGGSVKIETSLLSGTGMIAANGGAGEVGGGGGRIAVVYDYLGDAGDDLNGLRNITALGGRGGNVWGSAGTVLLRRTDQSYGDLFIDDNVTNGTAPNYTPLTHVGFGTITALTADTITTDGVVGLVPNGLKGLEINPNLNQSQTYTVVSNTSTTITVDIASKPALTAIAAVGNTYTGIYRFDNVYFRRGGYMVVGDWLVVGGTMKIDEYGRLTHFDATMDFESHLDLTVGTLEVTSTSSINVDARGYLGGSRSGNDATGQTTGNTNGAAPRSGGSYGGLGGVFDGGPTNPIYGSLTDPADLGSGGSNGSSNYGGGDGGGWVAINATNIILNGVISANGAAGSGNQSGSGSGGTINITTATLSGTGSMRADGGAGEVGGGGGRVAISYVDNPTMNTAGIQALGGQGGNVHGTNGTVYLEEQ
jgi:hypothetical protein